MPAVQKAMGRSITIAPHENIKAHAKGVSPVPQKLAILKHHSCAGLHKGSCLLYNLIYSVTQSIQNTAPLPTGFLFFLSPKGGRGEAPWLKPSFRSHTGDRCYTIIPFPQFLYSAVAQTPENFSPKFCCFSVDAKTTAGVEVSGIKGEDIPCVSNGQVLSHSNALIEFKPEKALTCSSVSKMVSQDILES